MGTFSWYPPHQNIWAPEKSVKVSVARCDPNHMTLSCAEWLGNAGLTPYLQYASMVRKLGFYLFTVIINDILKTFSWELTHYVTQKNNLILILLVAGSLHFLPSRQSEGKPCAEPEGIWWEAGVPKSSPWKHTGLVELTKTINKTRIFYIKMAFLSWNRVLRQAYVICRTQWALLYCITPLLMASSTSALFAY